MEIIPRVGYWLALSPDETTLAYLCFEKGLILQNLASGDELEVNLDIEREHSGELVYKSHLLWSPDSDLIVLTVAIGACGPEWSNAVVQVDVATSSQTTLIHEDEKRFYTVEWPQADRIVLKDSLGDSLWWLDTTTGKVTQAGE